MLSATDMGPASVPGVGANAPLSAKIATVLRVTSGNFLEQFDFFLFGFYATAISRAFFPAQNQFASLMATFAAFGAGFLMRPLGAIVLGGYIDRVGRRKGLIVTLGLMAFGTIFIAFVPGYATIGVAAPILVLIGRLLQGFSAGAELGGVSVYLSEMATPGHKGFYTAWQSASQQLSIVLAAALGFGLEQWLAPDTLADWGWRIPFFIGCSIIPFLFILRRSLQETEVFRAQVRHPSLREVYASVTQNFGIVLAGMFMVALTTSTFYLITVYTPTYGRAVLHLTAKDSLLVTLCVAISNFVWLPIGGAISDRVGRKPLLVGASALAIAAAYPALHWLAAEPSFGRMLQVLLFYSFVYGIYNGAMVVALTEVMPLQVRVVGFSLAYSLATAIFGGFTPVISTWLVQQTGDKGSPAWWITFAATCAMISALVLYRRTAVAGRSGA